MAAVVYSLSMKSFGQTIRDLRQQRHLTLKTVAKAAGINIGSLSRIENGKMMGTIRSHVKIAKALNTNLADLYASANLTDGPSKKKRAVEPTGIFTHTGGSTSELLTSNVLQKKMMPVCLKLKPRAKTAGEELPLGTERFIYVAEGSIDVVIKNVSNTISKGQTVYFNAALPHHIVNRLKTVSSCLIVTSPASL